VPAADPDYPLSCVFECSFLEGHNLNKPQLVRNFSSGGKVESFSRPTDLFFVGYKHMPLLESVLRVVLSGANVSDNREAALKSRERLWFKFLNLAVIRVRSSGCAERLFLNFCSSFLYPAATTN